MPFRALLLSLLLIGLSACGGGGSSSRPEPVQEGESRFTLALIPDTQFYSENNERGFLNLDPRYPNLPFEPVEGFYSITGWLAENAQALRIPFVIHLGDVVQSGVEKKKQWERASTAMLTLEHAGVPYSISTGNHDVADKSQYDQERNHGKELFLEYFSPERARLRNPSTFVGRDPLGYSEAHMFTALGQRFLVLALDWRASDATLDWARQQLQRHPQVPAIVMSHEILNVVEQQPTVSANGERLWEKLIRDRNQIFMTVSGHFHHAAHLRRHNDHGYSVDMILVDYQDEYAGGNGLLRLLEMDLAAGTVEAMTFSTFALRKIRDASLQSLYRACPDSWTTADCDQLIPDPNMDVPGTYLDHQYHFDLDFRERFGAFNGYTARVQPNWREGSLLDPLRDSLKQALEEFLAVK